jgi:hypothetical protein
MKKPVIDQTMSYTFFDYFKMNVVIDDLADLLSILVAILEGE